MMTLRLISFFFNTSSTTDIYTLSLHDALPISARSAARSVAALRGLDRRAPAAARPALPAVRGARAAAARYPAQKGDRKSTRLNSSHLGISYAVFCLKKKKKKECLLIGQDITIK